MKYNGIMEGCMAHLLYYIVRFCMLDFALLNFAWPFPHI